MIDPRKASRQRWVRYSKAVHGQSPSKVGNLFYPERWRILGNITFQITIYKRMGLRMDRQLVEKLGPMPEVASYYKGADILLPRWGEGRCRETN